MNDETSATNAHPGSAGELRSEDHPGSPDTLAQELDQLGIPATPAQLAMLQSYCRALWAWNARLNLTRHLDFPTFARRDVLDSYRLAECLDHGESILDVGTGGGVPGILCAILRPDLRVDVCDSVGKKVAALEAIVRTLGLSVRTLHGRGEELVSQGSYSTVTLRAVGPLKRILKAMAPAWPNCPRLLLIKGPNWVAERGEARHLGLLHNLELRRLLEYSAGDGHPRSVILQIRPRESS